MERHRRDLEIGKRSFLKLWKTKRFKVFNYHVLETLTLNEKLAFFGAIWPVPKAIAHDIRELNALRNGLAHSFFPENRRTSKPVLQREKHLQLGRVENLQ
jgi:hypothetical protein